MFASKGLDQRGYARQALFIDAIENKFRIFACLHDARQIATPADWRSGSDVIIPPSISDEEAKPLFPQGWTTLRPYLRTTRVD
ncbi:hypothetical protein HKD42_00060 [Altererythrobacter sp. RZ02]|uniref:Peroxiredoxin C-terminal domain-containing protein n=1 Tax=Pontixanthobacter rizhaonensis TaxID=2730337 RepID=A0A848QIA1_9SPHN|nr:hypothetical protein [Pontixanthobacter rizhaonensis]